MKKTAAFLIILPNGEKLLVPYEENVTFNLPVTDNNKKYSVKKATVLFTDWWKEQNFGCTTDIKYIPDIKVFFPNISENSETIVCSEFYSLYIWKELGIVSDLYNTPWDTSPDGEVFSSYYARDCMYGNIYSKDFGYFQCDECGRNICLQNPANGWHTQSREIEDRTICLQCYEGIILENGVDHFSIIKGEIPGMFLNEKHILESGWTSDEKYQNYLIAHGYSGYNNPEPFIKYLKAFVKARFKILINYESMAIGGMGGYISLYVKPNPESIKYLKNDSVGSFVINGVLRDIEQTIV